MSNSNNTSFTVQDMQAANIALSENDAQLIDTYFGINATTTPTTINATPPSGQRKRDLQQLGSGVNTTDIDPDLRITYEVIGTCRDCPVADVGAFELYDDSFRRSLQQHSSRQLRQSSSSSSSSVRSLRGVGVSGISIKTTRVVRIRDLKLSDDNDNADCVCLEGFEPKEPQAPGVQECVSLMNDELPVVAQQTGGLLSNLTLQTLIQLEQPQLQEDAGKEEEEEEAEEVVSISEPGGDGDDGGDDQSASAMTTTPAPTSEEDTVETGGDRKPDTTSTTLSLRVNNKDHPALRFNIWGRE